MNKSVNREIIINALKQCIDPELGVDVVSLGLIYEIEIKPGTINLLMTLTTPGCPLVPYFRQDIENKIKKATNVKNININLTFDPPWDPSKMSAVAKQQLSIMR